MVGKQPTKRDARALHQRYFAPLVQAAVTELHLSQGDAEHLAQDILLTSLRHLGTISDIETWLFGAIASAKRDQEKLP